MAEAKMTEADWKLIDEIKPKSYYKSKRVLYLYTRLNTVMFNGECISPMFPMEHMAKEFIADQLRAEKMIDKNKRMLDFKLKPLFQELNKQDIKKYEQNY